VIRLAVRISELEKENSRRENRESWIKTGIILNTFGFMALLVAFILKTNNK